MDLYVLNSKFEHVAVIDTFKSLIWTTRYFEPGDFELYVVANRDLLDYLKRDNYIVRDDDDTVMIIEKIEIVTDAEDGDFFIISGRSLESILDRRIIWTQTNVSAPACLAAAMLISENCIASSIPQRDIKNFAIDAESLELIDENINKQFTGDNLLTAIEDMAKQFGFGWRIRLVDDYFVFQCYLCNEVDVIFSQEFDNLINSNYLCDYSNYKNVALVAGEGEGTARKTQTTFLGAETSGLARREIFVDSRDTSSNDGEITKDEYLILLKAQGIEKLNENVVSRKFDGDIEPNRTYEYKKDYHVGNIVTIENEYGIVAKPRIIEIIESFDENGESVIPTFEEWEV